MTKYKMLMFSSFFLGLCAGLITGIQPLWVICFAAVILAMSIYLLGFLYPIDKRMLLLFFFFFSFILGYQGMYAKVNAESAFIDFAEKKVTVEGRVIESARYPNRMVYALGETVILEGNKPLAQAPKKEKLQLTIYDQNKEYPIGAVVKVDGVLRQPSEKRNPGGFDYRRYLASRNKYFEIRVSERQVSFVGMEKTHPLLHMGGQMKSAFFALSTYLPKKEESIFRAIILGDKSGLSTEDKKAFQGLGIMHIFAVSGMHVGFFMGLLSFFTKTANLPRVPSNLFIMICLLVYCSATGFSSAVMRAAIMLSIYLWGNNNWKRTQTANALFIAAGVLLFINPSLLLDPGFQMSFSATAFIIFITPIVKKMGLMSQDYLAVPVAAWLGTLPLTAYYFNIFSPLGILLAIPAGLMAGGVVIGGFVLLGINLLSEVVAAQLMVAVGGWIYYMQKIMGVFTTIPVVGGGIVVATPKLGWVFLYYLMAIIICLAYQFRYSPIVLRTIRKYYMRAGMLVLIILVVYGTSTLLLPRKMEVVFLDVGQGDCIFIQTPDKRTLLIDGGGITRTSNYGDLVVLPYLRHKGIKKVDVVINTHPHADHLAGLQRVAEELPIGLLVVPANFDEYYQELFQAVEQHKGQVYYAKRGQNIVVGKEVNVEVIHPPQHYPVQYGVNNHSVVTKIEYGEISFLLTGDLEMEAIMDTISLTKQTDVFKFPHHGSAGSYYEPYLEIVNPQVVVIQVGINNSFGHPGGEVLAYFAKEEIPVYRNDLHGAIHIFTDGRSLNKVKAQVVK